MKIPITILGTATAIPTAKRNHTSILIQHSGENILIDCGEGTQRQFRKARLNPCKLTRILITHWHGDHILGLPGLLQTLILNGYNKRLHIYGPKGIKDKMKKLIDLFVKQYGKLDLVVKEISDGKVFETKEFILESKSMKHGIACNSYSLIEKQKTRLDKKKIAKLKIKDKKLFGRLQQGKNIKYKGKTIKASQVTYKTIPKKITVILDTKINPNCYNIAKDSDLLICEATYLADSEKGSKLAESYKHLTAEQAGMIAKKSKSKKLILAHISQRYDKDEHLLLKEAKKQFKNTEIAKDLMKIEV